MLWVDQDHWLSLCTLGVCIVNAHWCRNSDGFLTTFTFGIRVNCCLHNLDKFDSWIYWCKQYKSIYPFDFLLAEAFVALWTHQICNKSSAKSKVSRHREVIACCGQIVLKLTKLFFLSGCRQQSVNWGNLINYWSMIWGQFEDLLIDSVVHLDLVRNRLQAQLILLQ